METVLNYTHVEIGKPAHKLVVLENGEVVITSSSGVHGTVLVSRTNPIGYVYHEKSDKMPDIKSVIDKEVTITFKTK